MRITLVLVFVCGCFPVSVEYSAPRREAVEERHLEGGELRSVIREMFRVREERWEREKMEMMMRRMSLEVFYSGKGVPHLNQLLKDKEKEL